MITRSEARAGLVPASVFKTDDALREQRHGGFDSHALPPAHIYPHSALASSPGLVEIGACTFSTWDELAALALADGLLEILARARAFEPTALGLTGVRGVRREGCPATTTPVCVRRTSCRCRGSIAATSALGPPHRVRRRDEPTANRATFALDGFARAERAAGVRVATRCCMMQQRTIGLPTWVLTLSGLVGCASTDATTSDEAGHADDDTRAWTTDCSYEFDSNTLRPVSFDEWNELAEQMTYVEHDEVEIDGYAYTLSLECRDLEAFEQPTSLGKGAYPCYYHVVGTGHARAQGAWQITFNPHVEQRPSLGHWSWTPFLPERVQISSGRLDSGRAFGWIQWDQMWDYGPQLGKRVNFRRKAGIFVSKDADVPGSFCLKEIAWGRSLSESGTTYGSFEGW